MSILDADLSKLLAKSYKLQNTINESIDKIKNPLQSIINLTIINSEKVIYLDGNLTHPTDKAPLRIHDLLPIESADLRHRISNQFKSIDNTLKKALDDIQLLREQLKPLHRTVLRSRNDLIPDTALMQTALKQAEQNIRNLSPKMDGITDHLNTWYDNLPLSKNLYFFSSSSKKYKTNTTMKKAIKSSPFI